VHFEPHATLGWVIGNLSGGDRRLRNYCVLGAILPDIDAAAYLFGPEAYRDWHHTFGHNVFLWAAFVAWVTWKCRSYRALVLSTFAFGSHLLTDALLSGWRLYLFWPFSGQGYILPGAVGLEAPINHWLVYLSPAVILLGARIWKRTPIDVFSPKFDRILVSFITRGTAVCGTCQKSSSLQCDECGQPVCLRHGTVRSGFRVECSACTSRNATTSP